MSGGPKLTADDLAYIRDNLGLKTQAQIARELGVSRATINRVKRGVTWTEGRQPKRVVVSRLTQLEQENATLLRQLSLSREHYQAQLADAREQVRVVQRRTREQLAYAGSQRLSLLEALEEQQGVGRLWDLIQERERWKAEKLRLDVVVESLELERDLVRRELELARTEVMP